MQNRGRAPSPAADAFVWAGGTLFIASLSYFLYSYETTFTIATAGPLSLGAVVWNAMLFSAFALHHSLFARSGVRQKLTQAFPRVERSIYVWVASLLFIAVCWLWRPLSGVVWEVDGVARWILVLGQVGGVAISVYSAALIDVWELAGIRQPNFQPPTSNDQRATNHQPPTDFEFKTRGPYGWVRHPIYLGWFLIVFSVGAMTMTRFVFAVVSCAYVLVAIPFEERSLRSTSAGGYERYMKRVSSKLIPGLW